VPFLRRLSGGDLGEAERRIVGGALAGRPATLASSDTMDWAARLPGIAAACLRVGGRDVADGREAVMEAMPAASRAPAGAVAQPAVPPAGLVAEAPGGGEAV
jgi:hypothetical protein